jgi:hypothetical protein
MAVGFRCYPEPGAEPVIVRLSLILAARRKSSRIQSFTSHTLSAVLNLGSWLLISGKEIESVASAANDANNVPLGEPRAERG